MHSKCTVKELGILMSSQKMDGPVNGVDMNYCKVRTAVDRSGYCVGTDAAISAYYLRIFNTKCTLLIKLQPMCNTSLEPGVVIIPATNASMFWYMTLD